MTTIETLLAEVAQRQDQRPSTKRGQKRMEARQRVLNAWRDLFLENRSFMAPITELTQRADVSVGNFYTLFPDRGELTREVVIECITHMMQGIDAISWHDFAESKEGGFDLARAFLSLIMNFVERWPDEIRFMKRIMDSRTPEGEEIKALWTQFWSDRAGPMIVNVFEREGTELPFDPVLATRVFCSMVLEAIEWWLNDPNPIPRERLIDSLAYLVVFGSQPR